MLQRKLARLRFHVGLALLLVPVSCTISLALMIQASLLKDQATTEYSLLFANSIFMLGMAFLMLVPAGLFLVANDDYKLRHRIRQDLDFGQLDVYRGNWSGLSKIESWLSKKPQKLMVRVGLIEPSRQGEVEIEVLPFSRLLWTLDGQYIARKITLLKDSYEQTKDAERSAWPVESRLLTHVEKLELEAHADQYIQWKQTILPVVLMLAAGTLSHYHEEWLPQSVLPAWIINILVIGIFYFWSWRAFDVLFNLYLSWNSVLALHRDFRADAVSVLRVSTASRTYLVLSNLKDINGEMPELASRIIDEMKDNSQRAEGAASSYGWPALEQENLIEFLPESGTIWSFNGQPADWR